MLYIEKVLPVIIAIVSLCVSIKAFFNTKKTMELSTKLQFQAWETNYFSEVVAWADKVCDLLTLLAHLPHDTKKKRTRFDALWQLSSMIDKGRWYFPNHYQGDYGRGKEPAYRGIRQVVLDVLVAAYDLANSSSPVDAYGHKMIHAKRIFVGEVQAVIDPRKRAEIRKQLLLHFEEAEQLRREN